MCSTTTTSVGASFKSTLRLWNGTPLLGASRSGLPQQWEVRVCVCVCVSVFLCVRVCVCVCARVRVLLRNNSVPFCSTGSRLGSQQY